MDSTKITRPRPHPETQTTPQETANGPHSTYTGWAMDAYYDMSYEQMLSAVRRMKEAGANVVWIAHANPARTYQEERETGLNPAVYYAFRDPALPNHQDAIAIVQAEWRLLAACREVGLKAVLSIGYQTQMGVYWNTLHPNDVRRKANGKAWQVITGSDLYASIYSPTYQRDLQEYYAWIEYDFIGRYWDVIMMLNMADEPLGGDYSSWANAEFTHRKGYTFEQVGNDPQRQQALGEFQAGVIVDYMKLAAGYWATIRPKMQVTMSFDGGAMREETGMPNLEALFRDTPANFVLTWDMYPRDRGNLAVPILDEDITRLFFLTRMIGGYSAQYGRRVWFWSAANSWGLGQTITPPDKSGTIADAQANMIYLAQLMAQTGGNLEGIAVWNYNIKTQGLYNYSTDQVHQSANWNPDEVFERVSNQFGTVRSIMNEPPGLPSLVFVRPPEWQYEQIGLGREDFRKDLIDWAKLDVLARNNVVTVEVGHWPALEPALWGSVRTAVVLSPPDYLSDSDISGLREWTANGGTLVATLGVAQVITGETQGVWTSDPTLQTYKNGRVFISREPSYNLFSSQKAEKLSEFWHNLIDLTDLQDGYTVQTRNTYLHFGLTKAKNAPSWPNGWDASQVQRYDTNGIARPLKNDDAALQRSEFVFAIRDKVATR